MSIEYSLRPHDGSHEPTGERGGRHGEEEEEFHGMRSHAARREGPATSNSEA